MKRTITLLIATALIFGMSQCKKNVETITPSNLGEAVHITVNVDDGGKHIVYPGTGAYVFENDDKLYVGNNGRYIGMLTYNNGAFSGLISSPSTDDYLHFYFVGGLTPSETPSAGSTNSFTVSIADQSDNLPVLSYAHSTQKYVDGKTTYGCTLLNKCGLVKFVPSEATSAAVTVGGMKNKATISFAKGSEGITPTGETGGITLYSEGEKAKWAILLPQDAVANPTVSIAGYTSTIESVPAVENNDYHESGVDINMAAAKFSVSENKTVQFSLGNLQYNANENNKWRFAEHQWDICQTTNGKWNKSGWVDLFGWGTWGEGNVPLNTSIDDDEYQWITDFQGELAGRNDWRTLTATEWQYLFESRNKASGLYGSATVNGIHGLVVLPDNWTLPSGLTFNSGVAGWNNNNYDKPQWETMEAAGAVFLPAAGYRKDELNPQTAVNWVEYNDGHNGNYWSSTIVPNGSSCAYRVSFVGVQLWDGEENYFRRIGMSVRLVY